VQSRSLKRITRLALGLQLSPMEATEPDMVILVQNDMLRVKDADDHAGSVDLDHSKGDSHDDNRPSYCGPPIWRT
jgi:hypothetical protein